MKRCFVIDGTKLKNKRREAGLTQVKLAEILGIDVSTLRKNEHEGPHKELLTLYIIEELTVREIARRLGRQKSTIAERLQRIFSLFPVEP